MIPKGFRAIAESDLRISKTRVLYNFSALNGDLGMTTDGTVSVEIMEQLAKLMLIMVVFKPTQ